MQHEKCCTSHPVRAIPSLCMLKHLQIKLTGVSVQIVLVFSVSVYCLVLVLVYETMYQCQCLVLGVSVQLQPASTLLFALTSNFVITQKKLIMPKLLVLVHVSSLIKLDQIHVSGSSSLVKLTHFQPWYVCISVYKHMYLLSRVHNIEESV